MNIKESVHKVSTKEFKEGIFEIIEALQQAADDRDIVDGHIPSKNQDRLCQVTLILAKRKVFYIMGKGCAGWITQS